MPADSRSPRPGGLPTEDATALPAGPSLELLVASIRDYAIIMLDADGRVVQWNGGAEAMKGYTAPEVLGRHFSLFYPAEVARSGQCEQKLVTAAARGHLEEEGWRVRKDGTRFWANVVLTAIRAPTGALIGFAKVTRDLSERHRAEESLRREQERFRLLVDGVQDYAIFVLDPGGHVVTWNPGAERIKGYAADEIIGQHFSRFYLDEDLRAGKIERELATALRDGRFEEEGWRVRKDGSTFWANVILTPLRGPAGELVGFAKITRDLTDRRKLEAERLRLAQAEEAVRLRDEFLSIASHELRTPLSALLLQIETVRRRGEGVDPVSAKQLDRALRAGERLAQLVDALLDVSRIATGLLALTPEPFDLVELVGEVVERMREPARVAGCALAMHAAAPRIVGTWDILRVEQIVTNLVANALRYAAGTAVDVAVSAADDHVIVEVRDHGPGINERDLPRVFQRFERGASVQHHGGLGLGLYVVRQIAEAHGGTVTACNDPGGGARVCVRLPRSPEQASAG